MNISMNKIGALYQVKKDCWLVFPSKEAAVDALGGSRPAVAGEGDPCVVAAEGAYWSKQLNCNVSYISPNDFVVLLETDGNCKKLLTSNGELGCIWFGEYYNNCFEKVSQ